MSARGQQPTEQDYRSNLVNHMPGERLADAPIATRDFDQWSDFMLEAFQHDQYLPIAADYLRRLQAGPIDESDLLSSYRRTMAGFILGYLPSVPRRS